MTTQTFEKSYFYGLIDRTFSLKDTSVESFLGTFPLPEGLGESSATNIKKLPANTPIKDMIVASGELEKKIASNNNPFLNLNLSNASGNFKGKLFSTDDLVDKQIADLTNAIISVSGSVNEYPRGSGNKSIQVSSYTVLKLGYNALELVPKLDEEFKPVILETIARLNNNEKPYRHISLTFLREFWKEYILAPAAKSHHHAYLGGLARHVLEMIAIDEYLHSFDNPVEGMENILKVVVSEHLKEMAENAQPEDGTKPAYYNRLVWGGDTISHITELIYQFRNLYNPETYNRHITKAFYPMHDIGKVLELTYPGSNQQATLGKLFPYASDFNEMDDKYNKDVVGITYHSLGQMMGHMPIGSLYLHDFFRTHDFELSAEELAHIHHLILSHHGKVEWNSTITPQTAEAVLFHFVDYIGSRYEGYLASLRD